MTKLSRPVNITEEELKAMAVKGRTVSMYYYREEYAVWVKDLLDRLHTGNKTIRIEGTNTPATIRVQYYQGAKYLMDNLDESGHYADLYSKSKLRTEKTYCELIVRRYARESIDVKVSEIAPWKDDFGAFLENAKPLDRFLRKDVALTPDDITWIQGQLASLLKPNGEPWFYGEVNEHMILIIKDEYASSELQGNTGDPTTPVDQ